MSPALDNRQTDLRRRLRSAADCDPPLDIATAMVVGRHGLTAVKRLCSCSVISPATNNKADQLYQGPSYMHHAHCAAATITSQCQFHSSGSNTVFLYGSRRASWVLHAHAVCFHHPAAKLMHPCICKARWLASSVFALSGIARGCLHCASVHSV